MYYQSQMSKTDYIQRKSDFYPWLLHISHSVTMGFTPPCF